VLNFVFYGRLNLGAFFSSSKLESLFKRKKIDLLNSNLFFAKEEKNYPPLNLKAANY